MLANPGYVARLQHGEKMNDVDFSTLYSLGDKGYKDDPLAD